MDAERGMGWQMQRMQIHEAKRNGDDHKSMPNEMTNVFPAEAWGSKALEVDRRHSDSVKWGLQMIQKREGKPQDSQMPPRIHDGLPVFSVEQSVKNQNSK
jgi:hypothetical protein